MFVVTFYFTFYTLLVIMAVSGDGTSEMDTKDKISFEDMSKENKIKFMIEYLAAVSDYKVVTSDEFC